MPLKAALTVFRPLCGARVEAAAAAAAACAAWRSPRTLRRLRTCPVRPPASAPGENRAAAVNRRSSSACFCRVGRRVRRLGGAVRDDFLRCGFFAPAGRSGCSGVRQIKSGLEMRSGRPISVRFRCYTESNVPRELALAAPAASSRAVQECAGSPTVIGRRLHRNIAAASVVRHVRTRSGSQRHLPVPQRKV